MKEELKVEFDSIKEQISAPEDQLTKASSIEDDLAEFAVFSIKYLANLKDKWWELDWEEKEQCENLLFPEGIFINEDGKLSHPSISAVFTLAEPNSNKRELDYSSNSLLVEHTLTFSHPVLSELKRWRELLGGSYLLATKQKLAYAST